MRTQLCLGALVLGATFALVPGAAIGQTDSDGRIVFLRGSNLYTMALDGSEPVRLTSTKVVEECPAVSPDGLQIAYAANRDELWVMNADGSGQRRLLARRPPNVRYAGTGCPAWSPSGGTIFVDRSRLTPNEICGSIFRIGTNGRGLKQVTRGLSEGHYDSEPDVSPDGRRIALGMADCNPGWSGGLAVVDPRGRLTKDLARLKGFEGEGAPTAPKWSPDGRRIAFEVWDLTVGFSEHLSLVNRDGSRVRRITPAKIHAEGPAWSPDGHWIAFSASKPSSFDGLGLFVIRPDGTGLHRLPGTKPADLAPSWFPEP